MTAIANSTVPVQQESVNTGNPVSESATAAIGGAVNYCLSNKPAVGDIMMSGLDEATFQAQRDTTWKLCDGRSVTGSQYQTLTGLTTIPDLRGVFPRGKDNGRGINPDGDLAIGAYTADKLAAHTHQEHYRIPNAGTGGSDGGGDHNRSLTDVTENVTSTGGNETAPKSCTVNFFIKINV